MLPIWQQAIHMELPYGNAQICYDRLVNFPELHSSVYRLFDVLSAEGDLHERIRQVEQGRKQILDDYLASGNSLREIDTTVNCVLSDMYIGLFQILSGKIMDSDLSSTQKLEGVRYGLEVFSDKGFMAWSPIKRADLLDRFQRLEQRLKRKLKIKG